MEGQDAQRPEPPKQKYELVPPEVTRKQTREMHRRWRREERQKAWRYMGHLIRETTFEELVALGLLIGGMVAYWRSGSSWYLALVAIGTFRTFLIGKGLACLVMLVAAAAFPERGAFYNMNGMTFEAWISLLIFSLALWKCAHLKDPEWWQAPPDS